jgi:hypothetical protein
MITNWIPIDEIYDKVVSDLTFPSSQINNVLNWIGECSETMQAGKVLTLQSYPSKVVDYKAKIPTGAVNIVGVYQGGARLHATNSANGMRRFIDRPINSSTLNVWQTVIPLASVIHEGDTLPVSLYIQALETMQSYTLKNEYCGVNYYQQHGNCLQFNFETSDEVEIFYEGLLVNSQGKLLLPDNIYFLEAITYWVENKLIRKGVIKGDMRESLRLFNDYRIKAMNAITFPSPEKMQVLADKLGLFTYDLYSDTII